MTSRGAVELVVLSVAYEAGVFAVADGDAAVVRYLFSGLVIMALANSPAPPRPRCAQPRRRRELSMRRK
jgi:hypothetical protein